MYLSHNVLVTNARDNKLETKVFRKETNTAV